MTSGYLMLGIGALAVLACVCCAMLWRENKDLRASTDALRRILAGDSTREQ